MGGLACLTSLCLIWRTRSSLCSERPGRPSSITRISGLALAGQWSRAWKSSGVPTPLPPRTASVIGGIFTSSVHPDDNEHVLTQPAVKVMDNCAYTFDLVIAQFREHRQ